MKTFFASPERLEGDDLKKEIDQIARNSIINELLNSVSGVLAVLNEHRQIVAVNHVLLEFLGIQNAEDLLGLRPGEAVNCIRAHDMPGGCGTGEFCASCGAAISIVSCLAREKAEEAKCAMTVEVDGKNEELFFRVRCSPVTGYDRPYLLLFLQDISYQQRLAFMERMFFHDISNYVTGILNTSYLMSEKRDMDAETTMSRAQTIYKLALRLASEINMQRSLNLDEAGSYSVNYEDVSLEAIFGELGNIFSHSRLLKNIKLVMPGNVPGKIIKTDLTLLLRVMNNMITNALEDSSDGDEVRVAVHDTHDSVTFAVWNRKTIPAPVTKRIFQKNFSTKAEMGRGYGTYSMKFIGEEILGGTVDFSTSENGTEFRFTLRV